MSPAEAGAIEYEEPDWLERFEFHCARWPRLPRYLQEDCAFHYVLRDWRSWHRASTTDGIIALAKLKIMPPRSAWNERPRDDATGYQHDDHMWLSFSGEQWRITAIEDRTLFLEKGFENDVETKQIDLNKAKWDKWLNSAVAVLEARR